MTQGATGDLAAALSVVRGRIARARERGDRLGESDTKATLIEPILAALGWRLDSLDDMRREFRVKSQDNPVDYALFIHRAPRLFVEAKALDMDASNRKWVGQTLNYATMVGVEWCVLTNGDEYRLYNAHAPVDVEEKLFRAVKVSEAPDDEAVAETLQLLSKDKMGENLLSVYWKAQFIDQNVKAVLRELLTGDDVGLVRLVRKRSPELRPADIRDSLKRAEIRIDFPLLTAVEERPATSAAREVPSAEPAEAAAEKADERKTPKRIDVEVADLIRAGLIRPPLGLEKSYKGVRLTARVLGDGRIDFAGKAYVSLSMAAGMARMTVIGKPAKHPYPPTNGWTFWQYADPQSGELHNIDDVRQAYLERAEADDAANLLQFRPA